jgi:hypothetical protein
MKGKLKHCPTRALSIFDKQMTLTDDRAREPYYFKMIPKVPINLKRLFTTS